MEKETNHIDLEAVNSLYKDFMQELSKIKEETNLKRLGEAIRISKVFVSQLREYVLSHSFADPKDEIIFFKTLKPKFYTHLFYYSEIFFLEIRKPLGSLGTQKEYFQSVLEGIEKDYDRFKEFYTYLRAGTTLQDEIYFLRGKHVQLNQHNHFDYVDPEFSTGYDLLTASYMANEKVAHYVNKKLVNLDKPIVAFDTQVEGPKIVWTDSKTALIELIYAFKAKGSFNNGKATLKELTEYFESAFGVEINNPTRDFQEILRRKTGYTIYLDGLKDNYLKYIDAIEERARK